MKDDDEFVDTQVVFEHTQPGSRQLLHIQLGMEQLSQATVAQNRAQIW